MFDRLIESEPEGADFKNRRSYFMVSSLVVGVLFTTAVVISIYAADISLGNSSFELTELIAPPEMAPIEPETPQPQPQSPATSQSQSQVPMRQVNMAPVDQGTLVPETISVVANNYVPKPNVPFELGPRNTDPVSPGTSGRESTGTGPGGVGGISLPLQAADVPPETEPPPVVKAPTVKPKVSGGVLNGKAKDLPKPVYSAAAKAVGAQGKVDVQVTIDETGRVISASAMNGHPLLRGAAEQAARNAKFTPTYLTGVAVKVTGVIFYNFNR